ncbi:MAG: hypothetical protein ABJB76_08505 [Candidatus Nitrosocosmicus sp.]
MNKQGMNISIGNIYDNYLRPLTKQGLINYERSILNGKENLYYPVNIGNDDLSTFLFHLTEDCRLIMNKPFDKKKVLEESFRTLLGRRSNEGVVDNKYKIIDIDNTELSLVDLLEKYFFNSNHHHTACSVILKFHNNIIEHYSIIDDKQSKYMSHLEKGVADKKDDSYKDFSIDLSCLHECYYCDRFIPTDNRETYQKHVVLSHENKPAYPSLVDLEKNKLKPQGKKWEI